jgi:hypothetical protein
VLVLPPLLLLLLLLMVQHGARGVQPAPAGIVVVLG